MSKKSETAGAAGDSFVSVRWVKKGAVMITIAGAFLAAFFPKYWPAWVLMVALEWVNYFDARREAR